MDDEGRRLSMTDKMLALIEAIEVEGGYAGATGKAKLSLSTKEKTSDDLQLLQLIASVAKQLPKSLSHEYFVLVDDLDLHWSGTGLQNAFLAAMFLSIRKMSRERQIKFVVSLRKSIYREINLEERDKFAPYVCEVEWGKASIQAMTDARLAFALEISPQNIWGRLFPPGAFDFLWNNTDGMPREVIRLAASCVDQAIKNGETAISTDSINQATRKFSDARRDELASLFQYRYPGLQFVTRQFAGRKKEFSVEFLQEVGMSICEIVQKNDDLPQLTWATCGFDDPVAFGRALVDSGFLMIKEGRSAVPRVANEDDVQLLSQNSWFAIHPMYHAGLGLDGYETFNG